MTRYRVRQITSGRLVKQQTRFYPQFQTEGDSSFWSNFQTADRAGFADVYFNTLAEAEQYLDTVVEEEVIHEYLPSDIDLETRFTTSIARDDDF